MESLKNIIYKNLSKQQLSDISKQTKEILYEIDGQILKYDLTDTLKYDILDRHGSIEEFEYFIKNAKITESPYGFTVEYENIFFEYENNDHEYDEIYTLNDTIINFDFKYNSVEMYIVCCQIGFTNEINKVDMELRNSGFSYLKCVDLLNIFCGYINDSVPEFLEKAINGEEDDSEFQYKTGKCPHCAIQNT